MTSQELKKRSLKFGATIAKFCAKISPDPVLRYYAGQLIRASSSVGANYRAACRAKSGRDFINKLKIVEEECDECLYFLELIDEIEPNLKGDTASLQKEGNELLAIFVASINTARKSQLKNPKSNQSNQSNQS